MKRWKFSQLLIVTVLLIFSVVLHATVSSRIKVNETTGKSLLLILKGSESLHSNLVAEPEKKDPKKIKEDTLQIIQLVRVSLKTAREKEPAENMIHLEKILMSIEARLQDYVNTTDSDQQRKLFFLREFYQYVIQIARQYDIKHDYKIFFCPRDKQKGTWIQKSTKAQNPFDTDGSLRKCGAVVM